MSRLRGPVLFVDHAAEDLVALHRRVQRYDGRLVMIGWPLLPGLVRTVPVLVPGVGPPSAIDGLRGWLERCQSRIEAKEAKPGQENLHQPFPGFSTDTNFGAMLVFDDALVREIPERQLRRLATADVKAAIAEGADLYADAARSLAETGRCRVILCARPDEIREHDSETTGPHDGGDADEEP